ncbi:MAG: glucose-6-phosphate isomerase [Bacteroidales bacterium]|jgi:glucose-6-phosphate isomerase|nr:glucose-6-phosphate isomerase [Bacteroidales bacterium]MDD3330971.1 glucose-6-phosphate isomerase [Bacteroidales bacterium]MDD3691430.1 glucose-6-phosphate isomerase [Bacteroidales bacterium]MDD4044906.1 glucose-6-phosphate isomerase [Bacteroidales bacterium]MDD4582009.1 glucose-6-phosphate isomerase [Bacteroidales bacterium]
MIKIIKHTRFKSKKLEQKVLESYATLQNRQGKGNDFLGWMDVDNIASKALISEIQTLRQSISSASKYIVLTGIGGSYLGARAVIEALSPSFPTNQMQVIYAGHNLSEDYHADLLDFLNTVDYSIVVISKSGTTTETSVSFRLLQKHCEKKYGLRSAQKRIICITDKEKGALKRLADQKGYKSFIIPDDVGGRYSVLTPVGLVPIALAGFNIEALIQGAKEMAKSLETPKDANLSIQYALFRNIMLNKGHLIEVMTSFEPKLFYFIEWWKQLFGESEGKEQKGIFPAGAIYTTDLHSMGQYMQEGQRIVFETVLSVAETTKRCKIPYDSDNYDTLNYISDKRISAINHEAKTGTILAHQDGGVPIIEIELETISERTLGALIYFFELACAISGYALGVNPFDQPGVEAYKQNMFALLNKEGYKSAHKKIQLRLKKQ